MNRHLRWTPLSFESRVERAWRPFANGRHASSLDIGDVRSTGVTRCGLA